MSGFSSVSSHNSAALGTTSDFARRSRAAASKDFGRNFEFMYPEATPPPRSAVGQLGSGPFASIVKQAELGNVHSPAAAAFGVGDLMYQTRAPSGGGSGGALTLGATNPFSDKTLTGKTGSGSRVEVTPSPDGKSVSVRFFSAKGGEISFDLGENAKINECKDGSLLVTLLDSNRSYLLKPDGTMQESKETVDNSGDDIYINIDGKMVDAGNGDDLIFNFASNATILGGNGNDMVLLGCDVMDLFIDTGDGDDTVIGSNISDSTINTGAGNDTVIFDSVGGGCTIDLGGGDNVADIESMDGALKAGQGNNTFDIGQALENATLVVGAGKNTYLGGGGLYLSRANR